MARGKVSYEHSHYGDEPKVTKKSTDIEMIHAYNWYGHYQLADDAKKYTLEYLKSSDKYKKEFIDHVSNIDAVDLYNIGWNCRLLSKGSELPKHIETKVFASLEALVDKQATKKEKTTEDVKVVSIHSRIAEYISERIADLEDEIDLFLLGSNKDFDAKVWFTSKNISPQISNAVLKYYSPLYDELFTAYKGTDAQLKEAYSGWKKKEIKEYMEFVRNIVSACEDRKTVLKATRKPRKKKVKSATVLVGKMQYAKTDKTFDLTSIKPEDIITAKQLWIFNLKTRNLTVFNSIGDSCLSVKGTTITGFDTNTSVTKKLRKPKVYLENVLSGGKVTLKQLMNTVKAKPSITKGRINKDVILLRAIK